MFTLFTIFIIIIILFFSKLRKGLQMRCFGDLLFYANFLNKWIN